LTHAEPSLPLAKKVKTELIHDETNMGKKQNQGSNPSRLEMKDGHT